jgi:DNA-binding HxlR family transcriptional regulator
MGREEIDRLERLLLLHLLEHRGQQIRFEASQWTTEFGIFRKFANEDQADLKQALRSLEMSRMIYRRTQYVVGYSEPKHVYSLTPSGHRKALEVQHEEYGIGPAAETPAQALGASTEGTTSPMGPRRSTPEA